MSDGSGLRLKSVRVKDAARFADSLTNALTGMGTTKDPRMASAYLARTLTPQEIAAAYSGSGLMRKIINIPAMDMVREWRSWNAEPAAITAIENEEKRLGLRQKVRQAEIYRGMGGGAFVMGLPGIPSQPVAAQIGRNQIAYIHVVGRDHIHFDRLQDDVREPGYGEPAMWRMTTTTGQVEIHPSRVIAFRADPAPPLTAWSGIDAFWGESKVQQVLDAVQDCDTARQAFAALIQKARNTRIGIPDLLNTVSSTEGEAAFQRRMAAFQLAESIYSATVYDSGNGEVGEKIEDATYKFEGMKDALSAFMVYASAVSDIPQSRLFGTAPEGMNSSGGSQQMDWNKMVGARQTLDLAPCLARLDPYLVQSAVGSSSADIWSEFNPLDQETEAQEAERFGKLMVAVTALQNTGTIPEIALTKGVQSLMIDEGFLPGLEAALGELGEDERFGVLPDLSGEGGDPDLAAEGEGGQVVPFRRAANDAKPRTLYVSRAVLNRDDLQAWATEQGLGELQADLHVTIAYSKTPLDWMRIDGEWNQDEKGGITIQPGGVRIVEPLGDRTAVLLFTSSSLTWRHESIVRAGASHDYPDYQPHVSLTAAEVDLTGVEPYRGVIRFGPEVFAEINEDWKAS